MATMAHAPHFGRRYVGCEWFHCVYGVLRAIVSLRWLLFNCVPILPVDELPLEKTLKFVLL